MTAFGRISGDRGEADDLIIGRDDLFDGLGRPGRCGDRLHRSRDGLSVCRAEVQTAVARIDGPHIILRLEERRDAIAIKFDGALAGIVARIVPIIITAAS